MSKNDTNPEPASGSTSGSPLSDFERAQLESALVLIRKGEIPLARGVLLADKLDTFERRELAEAIRELLANAKVES